MNELAPRVFTPPRPNPGPEPWPEPAPAVGVWIVIAAAAVVLGWWGLSRRRRSALAKPTARSGRDPSAAESLIELALTARGSLAARLGPAWRARTTEEIARDGALREALGDAVFEPLVQFLGRVDTLKFAVDEPAAEGLAAELERWSAWTDELERTLKSKADRATKPPSPRTTTERPGRHSAASDRSPGGGSGRRTT